MGRKRIRIGFEDSDGAKYNLNLEGNVTREKMLKIFDLMKLLDIEEPSKLPDLDTMGGRIWNVVDKHYPIGKFTSSKILEKYEDEYDEPIKLSIISTYLARFASKRKIERSKTGREWTYQTIKIIQKNPNEQY